METVNIFQKDEKQNRLELIKKRHEHLKNIREKKKLDDLADKIQRESEE